MITTPYLLFLGDAPDQLAAKVAQGICDWRPENAVAQFRMPDCKADLGLEDMSLQQAWAAGARTLVIGVANRGGVINPEWRGTLVKAMELGFDLASGLHVRLTDDPVLSETAKTLGRKLHDVRVPQVAFPIADGIKRTGKRLLTIGTDCSVGKMYTSLAVEREMRARAMNADFQATGQTGILVTGRGIPLDAVVADFMAGAVEWLTPNAEADHWDIIEGQGSLFHVSFSGVTMALIHGGQPDALILCHEPTRTHLRGLPSYDVPSLQDLQEVALPIARMANPNCQVVGISINTQHLTEEEALACVQQVEAEMGLPTVDPFRHGAGRLVDALDAI